MRSRAVRAGRLNAPAIIFVWTHDSIGVGEDGPTAPTDRTPDVATIAMPNLAVVRPADATRTCGSLALGPWRHAEGRWHGTHPTEARP